MFGRAFAYLLRGVLRMDVFARIGDAIWNPWLLGCFLLVGGYYSVCTGFFQVFGLPLWLKTTIGGLLRPKAHRRGTGLTQIQALATALASTIGTGSIAGVATAIFYGGPGAVFWIWVSALLGMMTGCAEKILAVRYRSKSPEGGWEGGPMEYMKKGLRAPFLAGWFSFCCVAAALSGGSMVQANSISTVLESVFGCNRLSVGVAAALLTGCVIVGGIGRIGRVSEALVPAMALLFIGGGVVVVGVHAAELPRVLGSIFTSAWTPKAAAGGGVGYGVAAAMRYGIARGVFTNEAGLGSSAMAHAAANVEEPAEQGMWGIFEVFVATILICSVTALVILTSGVYSQTEALWAIEMAAVAPSMLGAPLSAAAFGTVFGQFGGAFVALSLLLFAFTSLLGWSYYGERGLAYLTETRQFTTAYRIVFLLCAVAGSVGDVTLVWQLADICNGLMALPNLITLFLLSPEALRLLRRWRRAQKSRFAG